MTESEALKILNVEEIKEL